MDKSSLSRTDHQVRKGRNSLSWGRTKNAKLLRSVSRSFYLSVPLLPSRMREPVALGYLLARASDTLADSIAIPESERQNALSQFGEALTNSSPLPEVENFVSQISHEGERELLTQLPAILDWYSKIDEPNRKLVNEVVEIIIAGQQWDLGFFHAEESQVCPDRKQLLNYTYQVAGCVGEFWTKVGFENLGDRFAYGENRDSLLSSGKKLGQGLQLINILRDLHEDLPAGRCYLPADELKAAGWDGESKLTPEIVSPVFSKWLNQCREFLESGHDYVRELRNRRIRFSTMLPLLLAEATADLLEEVGVERVMTGKVKIGRSDVRKAMLRALFF